MISVMVGCVDRTDVRMRMLKQLQEHNINPVLFLSPCDGKTLRLYENWKRTLDYAINSNDDVLLLEDDGIIKSHFTESLNIAKQLNAPCYFYINEVLRDGTDENKNLYPANIWHDIQHAPKIPLQSIKLQNVNKVNSILATYIPRHILVRFWATYHRGNLDSQLCRWLYSNNIDTYSVIPHAVQHDAGKSYWNGTVTRSFSASADCVVQ